MKGFEQKPTGHLLRQILDLETPMGIAYERSVGYEKAHHAHDRFMIVCPRGATRMKVATKRPAANFKVDSTQVLLVPAHLEHDDAALGTIYDTLALLPVDTYLEQAISENGLGAEEREKLRSSCHLVKRSRWLDDILNRYFFERVINAASPVGCTFFLEKQIMNELMRLLFAEKFKRFGSDLSEEEDSLSILALQFIEANLFEEISVGRVAQHVKSSESSLLRAFKKAYQLSPYAYVKKRRLEEARRLLQSGEYNVTDVALLVGYDDSSAFTRAYKQAFGKAPSQTK